MHKGQPWTAVTLATDAGLRCRLCLRQARRFLDVTREWRRTINAARQHGQLSELLRHSELPTLLADLARGLENVHKVRARALACACAARAILPKGSAATEP